MAGTMQVEKGTVKIRMYRPGLGDCFLLAFPGHRNEPRYMMIDCGVLLGTANDKETIREIVRDINTATGGHLHVLVVTHEHWDHISGFVKAEELFKQFKVDRVWWAWTEDPNNVLANELKKKHNFYLQALGVAAREVRGIDEKFAGKLDGLLDFYGGTDAVFGVRKGSKYIWEFLGKLGKEDPLYCYPGDEPLEIPGVKGIRVYVLGPPESKKLIKKSRPSKRNKEVYLTDSQTDLFDNFASEILKRFGAAGQSFQPGGETRGARSPFDQRYERAVEEIDILPENAELKEFVDKYYRHQDEAWRSVDSSWLELTGDLALKLDAHTNNTCLTLAFEIVDSGKVLLFPGDAQVGNWLGWHDLKWNVDEEEVTCEDLLNRTVFYKVGHHGSHNATLKEKGLEMMTGGDLVAMIPVDKEMAEKKKWKMPYPPLAQRLNEMCKGRVIRLDDGPPDEKPETLSTREWKKFKKAIHAEDLFFELTIK